MTKGTKTTGFGSQIKKHNFPLPVAREIFDEAIKLLESLALAAVTHDTSALDQAGGAARQFLNKLKDEK